MTLKQIIIQKFLTDDVRNFSAYQTDAAELGQMYDQLIQYSKLTQKNWFERLLVETKAVTTDGRIRFDRQTTFFDKESKKDISVKVCFRYPVFNYLKTQWQEAMDSIKSKNLEVLKTL